MAAHEALAQTLRDLWSQSGASEEVFARDYLGISRSHFANLMGLRSLPSQDVIDRCCDRFPESAELLQGLLSKARVERQERSSDKPETDWRTDDEDSSPHRCKWLTADVRSGFESAFSFMLRAERQRSVRSLRLALRNALDEDPTCFVCVQRAWRNLGELYYDQADLMEAENCYGEAIKAATAGGDERAAVHYTDRLAMLLMRKDDFDHAIEIMSTALRERPENSRLWRRYGIIRWYEGLLPDAYAILTLALNLGAPKPRIYHARGQVLAELRLYERAVAELSSVMGTPLPLDAREYARSSRAFALAGLGKFDIAMREFAIAEEHTPDNAWLHYFRAVCYDERGNSMEAISGYRQALELASPPLNKPKQEYAELRLRELGAQ